MSHVNIDPYDNAQDEVAVADTALHYLTKVYAGSIPAEVNLVHGASVVLALGNDFDFSMALAQLRCGKVIARRDWSRTGKVIVPSMTTGELRLLCLTRHPGDETRFVESSRWLLTNVDIMATDWYVVG